MIAGFVNPTAKAAGPEGGKFMQRLARQNHLPLVMELAGLATVLSGLWLYWLVSGGFQITWIASRPALTIGGIMAILAYILAFFMQKPAAKRIGMIGQEIQASGGPPSPEQIAEMQAQQKKLSQGALWSAVLLTIAVIGMALAR